MQKKCLSKSCANGSNLAYIKDDRHKSLVCATGVNFDYGDYTYKDIGNRCGKYTPIKKALDNALAMV